MEGIESLALLREPQMLALVGDDSFKISLANVCYYGGLNGNWFGSGM